MPKNVITYLIHGFLSAIGQNRLFRPYLKTSLTTPKPQLLLTRCVLTDFSSFSWRGIVSSFRCVCPLSIAQRDKLNRIFICYSFLFYSLFLVYCGQRVVTTGPLDSQKCWWGQANVDLDCKNT